MYLISGKFAAWKSRSNLSKASFMIELRGSIEEGPLGLSSCLPSRPITAVEDLGKDSLGSGNLRMHRNVSTPSAYRGGMSDRATSL